MQVICRRGGGPNFVVGFVQYQLDLQTSVGSQVLLW